MISKYAPRPMITLAPRKASVAPSAPNPAERNKILDMLQAFAAQRPGLIAREYISDWRDADGRRAYRQAQRETAQDLHHVRELLAAVRWRESIDVDALKAQLGPSGRLTLDDNGLSYCTGQYFPTEYRKAVCRALASALWAYWRKNGCETGHDIRAKARQELSRGIAQRYFN